MLGTHCRVRVVATTARLDLTGCWTPCSFEWNTNDGFIRYLHDFILCTIYTMGTSFSVHVRSHSPRSPGHLHCQSARPGCQSRLLACCQRPSGGLASWLPGRCPPVNHVDVNMSYVTGTASQWGRLAQRQKKKNNTVAGVLRTGVPDTHFL